MTAVTADLAPGPMLPRARTASGTTSGAPLRRVSMRAGMAARASGPTLPMRTAANCETFGFLSPSDGMRRGTAALSLADTIWKSAPE